MVGENEIVLGRVGVYEVTKLGNVYEEEYEISIEVEGYLSPL